MFSLTHHQKYCFLIYGAINFAIVTSGKTPDEAKDFNELLKMIKEINALGLKSCASIGICNIEQAKKLKEAGLNRFHHIHKMLPCRECPPVQPVELRWFLLPY